MKAMATMLNALHLVHGSMHHQTNRKMGERALLKMDFLRRQPGEPPPKTATDEDGYAAMLEEGDAPLWDETDPKTWAPYGWQIKGESK